MNRLKGLSLLVAAVFCLMLAPIGARAACSLSATPDGTTVTLSATGCDPGSHYYFRIFKSGQTSVYRVDDVFAAADGSATRVFTGLDPGGYDAKLYLGIADEKASSGFSVANVTNTPLRCGDPCNPNDTTCPASCPSVFEGGQWKCNGTSGPPGPPGPRTPSSSDFFCGATLNSDNPQVNTALGCVPVRVGPFATWLFTYIFGIAGGIAFLLMVYGFILLSMTGGDPKKMQGAQETISAAITGLIVCIFSVFLLRLIAVNILRIPGIN